MNRMIGSVLTGILSTSPSLPLQVSFNNYHSIKTRLLHPFRHPRYNSNNPLLRPLHNPHANLQQRNLDHVPDRRRSRARHDSTATSNRDTSCAPPLESPCWHSLLDVQPSAFGSLVHKFRTNGLFESAWTRVEQVCAGS
jgi:hypothetical protein